MTQDAYCSMIHGGLALDFVIDVPRAQHCCLRNHTFAIDTTTNFWLDKNFIPLRDKNAIDRQWDAGCANCEKLEKAGMPSFRTGMNQGLGVLGKTNLSGPARIDMLFDISCNLACRTCGPQSSTYWQHHLKQHGEWPQAIFSPKKRDQAVHALKQLDLSNLRQLVFCGGETLLGQEYWNVARWLTQNVPNAKDQLTICFQTNGTQTIPKRYFDIIENTKLVKLHISIDGIHDRFEYLRWPAKWPDTMANIFDIRDTCPSNVMFVIEETVSVFNVLYLAEADAWIRNNFSTNREGDIVNHTRHLAHGLYSLDNSSQDLIDLLKKSGNYDLVPRGWQEKPETIQRMLAEIRKFDSIRGQSFQEVFPEVWRCFERFHQQ